MVRGVGEQPLPGWRPVVALAFWFAMDLNSIFAAATALKQAGVVVEFYLRTYASFNSPFHLESALVRTFDFSTNSPFSICWASSAWPSSAFCMTVPAIW